MTDLVQQTIEDGVVRIRLNRPEKKNALTAEMYARLDALLREADADAEMRVVSIGSTGPDFTAGNDLSEFLQGHAAEGARDTPAVIKFLDTLMEFSKPLVAAVGGVAIGIGTTLLLHCDLIVAAEDAVFGLPFVKLGLVPEAAASLLLPALVGYQRAAELLLLGETFDAHTARDIGLVNRVVPAGVVAAEADALCRALAARPTEAVRATRRLLRGDRSAIRARHAEETRIFAERLASPEAAANIAAFLARETCAFTAVVGHVTF